MTLFEQQKDFAFKEIEKYASLLQISSEEKEEYIKHQKEAWLTIAEQKSPEKRFNNCNNN